MSQTKPTNIGETFQTMSRLWLWKKSSTISPKTSRL